MIQFIIWKLTQKITQLDFFSELYATVVCNHTIYGTIPLLFRYQEPL